jgi:hypothetical protein
MEDETEHLALLLGRRKTEGWTKGTAGGPPARIDAVDTYEWLPGGRALLHTVDTRVGDEKIEGAGIIGYDPARSAYVTQYSGTDRPAAYEATLSVEDGATLWRMRSQADRFTRVFSGDGNTITGHWELLRDDSTWQPWMDITLTKQN